LKLHETIINIELDYEKLKVEYFLSKPNTGQVSDKFKNMREHLFWNSLENNLKILQYQALLYIPLKLFNEINDYRNNMMNLSDNPEDCVCESKVKESLYNIREIIQGELSQK
jgi:hypothetical protein